MGDVPGMQFPGPDDPATMSAKLEQAKFIMAQLPFGPAGPEVEITPPDNLGPVEYDFAAMRLAGRRRNWDMMADLLEAELKVATAANVPEPPLLVAQVNHLLEEGAALMTAIQAYF